MILCVPELDDRRVCFGDRLNRGEGFHISDLLALIGQAFLEILDGFVLCDSMRASTVSSWGCSFEELGGSEGPV